MLLVPCRRARCRPLSSLTRRSVHNQSEVLRPNRDTGGVSLDVGPTEVSVDGQRTWRKRKTKARSLPLPPVLDPIVKEARGRWRQTKSIPSDDNPSALQQELAQNTYAQILASPVRMCAYTRVRQPSQLLLRFRAQHGFSEGSERVHPPSRLVLESETPDPHRRLSTASAYWTNDARLVAMLNKKKTWTSAISARLLEFAGAETAKQSDPRKLIEWDSAVSERVLRSHRTATMSALVRAATEGALTPYDEKERAACILMHDSALMPGDIPKGQFTCVLPAVLGPELYQRLISEHKEFDAYSLLAVEPGEIGHELCVALWRLELYTAHDAKATPEKGEKPMWKEEPDSTADPTVSI